MALLLIFFIGSASYLIVKKDEILQQTLAVVNKSLTTPVKVEKIDFSIVSDWPNATIYLLNVHTEKQPGFKNNLIDASEIRLSVDLFSVFSEVYNINEITIKEAIINLEVNPQKRNNYNIFKRPESDTVETRKNITIESISLFNSTVNYEDYSENKPLKSSFSTEELSAKTNFLKNEIGLQPSGSFTLKYLTSGDLILPEDQAYRIDADIKYLSSSKILILNQCSLQNDQFEIESLFGRISLPDAHIKLSTTSDDLDFKDLKIFIPSKYLSSLNPYKLSGQIEIALTIEGPVSNTKKQKLAATFSGSRISGVRPASNTPFSDVELEGKYLKEINTSYATGLIKDLKGKGTVFDEPITFNFSFLRADGEEFSGDVAGKLNGRQITSLYPGIALQNLSGQLSFDTHIQKIDGQIVSDGEVDIRNASFSLKNLPAQITKLNSILVYNNSEIAFQELTAQIGKSDLSFAGRIVNPVNLTKDNAPFLVEGNLMAGKLYIDELMGITSSEQSPNSGRNAPPTDYTLPESVRMSVDVDVSHLYYRKFYGRSLTGNIRIRDQRLVSEEFTLETIGGNVSGTFSIFPEYNFLRGVVKGQINNLSADSIFYVFENFDQDFIRDHHLKGQISASFNTDLFLTRNLNPIPKTIKSTIDASITNGRLIDFEPMYRLSTFVEEQQLAELSFSKLTNKITINESRISIPEMKIESNVSNIELSGWHSFDQNIEYHLKVPLKKKYKKDKDERFGTIADADKNVSNLFLKITGTTDDYKISYDRIATLNKVKEDIRKEGKDLIRIFQQKGKDRKSNTTLEEDVFFDFKTDKKVKKDTVSINQ